MAAKRTMLWLLVWRALRLRFQRVSVVFAALMVGATIVTALFAVWFDINTKMSEELRTFGANFYIGPGHGSSMPQLGQGTWQMGEDAEHSRSGAAGAGAWRQSVVVRHGAYRAGKSGDGWRVVRVAAKTGAVLAGHR